jgi:hypothetical protein
MRRSWIVCLAARAEWRITTSNIDVADECIDVISLNALPMDAI